MNDPYETEALTQLLFVSTCFHGQISRFSPLHKALGRRNFRLADMQKVDQILAVHRKVTERKETSNSTDSIESITINFFKKT